LVAVAALAMAIPGSASLERAWKAASSVTISSKFPAFSGSVRSKAGICRKGRRVQLLKRTRAGDPKPLGRDTTNSSGSWAVRLDNVKPGAYYARTKRRVKERHGSRAVCGADRSRVVVVD
jgi:hypothetical protein